LFENKKLNFGTELKLIEISHTYPDGKMDIKTEGLKIFKVLQFEKSYENKLYPAGKIEYIDDDPTGEALKNYDILEKLKELFLIMKITKEVPKLDDNFTSYQIAHLVGFSLQQEYHLLSIASELERLDFIHDHLVNLIPVVKQMENLRRRAEMNGHFKNIIPPEF
jgi:Lon protease-like protein